MLFKMVVMFTLTFSVFMLLAPNTPASFHSITSFSSFSIIVVSLSSALTPVLETGCRWLMNATCRSDINKSSHRPYLINVWVYRWLAFILATCFDRDHHAWERPFFSRRCYQAAMFSLTLAQLTIVLCLEALTWGPLFTNRPSCMTSSTIVDLI